MNFDWMKMDRLTPRERLLLLLAATFIGLLLLGLSMQWLVQQRIRLRDDLQAARRNVKVLQKLKADIDSMAAVGGTLPDQNRLLAIVTQALQNQKLNATTIRDRVEKADRNNEKIVVDMSFSGITLEPLFKLLYEIEYTQASGITVGELTIRRVATGRDIYDVHLVVYVISPMKKGNE